MNAYVNPKHRTLRPEAFGIYDLCRQYRSKTIFLIYPEKMAEFSDFPQREGKKNGGDGNSRRQRPTRTTEDPSHQQETPTRPSKQVRIPPRIMGLDFPREPDTHRNMQMRFSEQQTPFFFFFPFLPERERERQRERKRRRRREGEREREREEEGRGERERERRREGEKERERERERIHAASGKI